MGSFLVFIIYIFYLEGKTIMFDQILELQKKYGQENLIDSIKTIFNCHYCEIDDEGNVWIEQPQLGHWLNDEEISRIIDNAGNV